MHYFARWKFLQKGFRTVRFVHLECIFTGNGQLRSTVLSSDLSFVSSDITGIGIEYLVRRNNIMFEVFPLERDRSYAFALL